MPMAPAIPGQWCALDEGQQAQAKDWKTRHFVVDGFKLKLFGKRGKTFKGQVNLLAVTALRPTTDSSGTAPTGTVELHVRSTRSKLQVFLLAPESERSADLFLALGNAVPSHATSDDLWRAHMGSRPAAGAGPAHEYRLGRTLGTGTFGKVKLAQRVSDGQKFAIKCLNRARIVLAAQGGRLAREIRLLKLLNHPNVIRLHEVLHTPSEILMVMEYVEGGDLLDVLNSQPRFKEQEVRHIFTQICCGVAFCHSLGVAHRDLKPENILIERCEPGSHMIRVADFGLSCIMQAGQMLTTACGSPHYVAPEVLNFDGSARYDGRESDVWSLGVILHVRRPPAERATSHPLQRAPRWAESGAGVAGDALLQAAVRGGLDAPAVQEDPAGAALAARAPLAAGAHAADGHAAGGPGSADDAPAGTPQPRPPRPPTTAATPTTAPRESVPPLRRAGDAERVAEGGGGRGAAAVAAHQRDEPARRAARLRVDARPDCRVAAEVQRRRLRRARTQRALGPPSLHAAREHAQPGHVPGARRREGEEFCARVLGGRSARAALINASAAAQRAAGTARAGGRDDRLRFAERGVCVSTCRQARACTAYSLTTLLAAILYTRWRKRTYQIYYIRITLRYTERLLAHLERHVDFLWPHRAWHTVFFIFVCVFRASLASHYRSCGVLARFGASLGTSLGLLGARWGRSPAACPIAVGFSLSHSYTESRTPPWATRRMTTRRRGVRRLRRLLPEQLCAAAYARTKTAIFVHHRPQPNVTPIHISGHSHT